MSETELRGVLELVTLVLERTRKQLATGQGLSTCQTAELEYAEARARRALRSSAGASGRS